jgi:peptidoglycan/xylan/chitin deacetylase (PgdA/CDA1 family)
MTQMWGPGVSPGPTSFSRAAHTLPMKRLAVLALIVLGLAVAAPAQAQALPVTYRVDTKDPVVFITVDDGIITPQAALDYVEKHRIPITSFLTSSQVTDAKVRYFERISRWGSIQNHTTTHASLATSDAGLIKRQVCPVQVDYRRTFGDKPWMLRPPYGAGPSGSTLHDVARRCKLTDIVMWDAVVDQGRLTTRYGGGLQPGSVILLHFTGNLAVDLKVAVSAARAQGLKPANLGDYLRSPRSR